MTDRGFLPEGGDAQSYEGQPRALGPMDELPTTSTRELAANGYYEFVRAFRNNDLDYHTFYLTMPEREARAEMRDEFGKARSTAVFTDGLHPLERKVTAGGLPRQMHVVLVTMDTSNYDPSI